MESNNIRILASLVRPLNLKRIISRSGMFSIVPFYHTVSDVSLPHIHHLYRPKKVEEFETDLEELMGYYKPVSLRTFIEERENPGKGNSLLLTFDDGLVECHEVIAPILKKKGLPALFFLNNRFIDNQDLFYRYKASILIDYLGNHAEMNSRAANYLGISEEQVKSALLLVKYTQLSLLDDLAEKVELDFKEYMDRNPIYMSKAQVKDLISWGFDIGGHSLDHPSFAELNQEDMLRQTRESLTGLSEMFRTAVTAFAFPFTSNGIPAKVIHELLANQDIRLLLGTQGFRKSDHPYFLQRIDMEEYPLKASEILKIKYLRYRVRRSVGMHRYRY